MSIALERVARPTLDFGLQGVGMKIVVGKADIEFLESGVFFTEKPMSPHGRISNDQFVYESRFNYLVKQSVGLADSYRTNSSLLQLGNPIAYVGG